MLNYLGLLGFKAKMAMQKFFTKENGEVNVVAMVVLIAVAVVLALLLKDWIATIYTNPILEKDAIPTDSTQVNVKPYRYLFGDEDAEDKAKDFIRKEIKKTGTGLFSGMEMTANICKVRTPGKKDRILIFKKPQRRCGFLH